jgi:hypothetical protein
MEFVVGVSGDRPAAFVHQSVVKRAQQDEVVAVGGPSVDPVPYVVDVTPPGAVAARESAAAVAVADAAG